MGYVASHMAAVPSSGFRRHLIFLESPLADEIKKVDATRRQIHILQIETRILPGSDVAKTVVDFARQNQVTQIFVAHTQTGLLERRRRKNFSEDIVRLAQDLQVTVVADRSRTLSSSQAGN